MGRVCGLTTCKVCNRFEFTSRKEEKIYKAGDLYKSYSL